MFEPLEAKHVDCPLGRFEDGTFHEVAELLIQDLSCLSHVVETPKDGSANTDVVAETPKESAPESSATHWSSTHVVTKLPPRVSDRVDELLPDGSRLIYIPLFYASRQVHNTVWH